MAADAGEDVEEGVEDNYSRLTDGQGRTVDFRNTVIVMTSNLGSQLIQEMAGADQYDAMKAAVMEIVGQQFRPKLIELMI